MAYGRDEYVNSPVGIAVPDRTQIGGNVDRAFGAVSTLEANAAELGERIAHVLCTEGSSIKGESVEPAYDCPLAQTIAVLTRRIEIVAAQLSSLRNRVEL